MNTGLNFTQAAADKVASLIEEEKKEGNEAALKLRVYVVGGGCSGLQYGFTFDENQQDDDTVFEKISDTGMTVTLLVDSLSYPYLKNAEIDYMENITGSQFVIKNPDAETTCGCGSSFSMKDENLDAEEEE